MSTRTSATLTLLLLVNTLNFFDRQIIGVVGEAIRRDWTLDDTALGALGTAFTLLYAVAGVPFGWMCDRMRRTWLLGAGVLLWSALTAASAWATSFWQLFVARLLVGVGEAVCSPAATSLVGDLLPASRRARALSVVMLGLPVGLAASYGVGGWVAQHWGWRAAFLVAGVPGVLVALGVFVIAEPPRGAAEPGGVGAVARPGSAFRVVLSLPTMWWLIASGALHNFAMYTLSQFLTPFLMRVHGASLQRAGLYATLVYGIAGAVGLLVGGTLADWAYVRRREGRTLVAAAAAALAVPCMLAALARPSGAPVTFTLLIAGACAAMYVYYASAYATIQDVIEPARRGTAMALYFFAMYTLGGGLGPLATGMLSDTLTARAARAAGVGLATPAALEPFRAAGLHAAMYAIPALTVALVGVMLMASRTVARDVARLEAWMGSSGAGTTASVPPATMVPAQRQ